MVKSTTAILSVALANEATIKSVQESCLSDDSSSDTSGVLFRGISSESSAMGTGIQMLPFFIASLRDSYSDSTSGDGFYYKDNLVSNSIFIEVIAPGSPGFIVCESDSATNMTVDVNDVEKRNPDDERVLYSIMLASGSRSLSGQEARIEVALLTSSLTHSEPRSYNSLIDSLTHSLSLPP